MSGYSEEPRQDADRELSPYDEGADAEAPAADLNREEELRSDADRPVVATDEPFLPEPEEAAYSIEEPSENVE